MILPAQNDRLTWFLRLLTFVIVVAALRLAQDVLLPIAFALLLAFLLSPLVVRLMRRGAPRALAILLAVGLAFAAIGGVGWLVVAQAVSLGRELPSYEQNIREKVQAILHPRTPAVVKEVSGLVENLRRDLKSAEPAPPPPPAGEAKPVPVEVKPAAPSPWDVARGFAAPLLRPLGMAGIVVVFVIMILFQREDLRERFIRIVSAGRLNLATQAVDDAAARVSRYLGMMLLANSVYGVLVGVGLFCIGIPNAPLWGLISLLLRFVPFVGPWIAAAFPVVLSLAVDPGWTTLLWTLGLFVVLELVSNNVIEVALYGASTGISNLALLVAAAFWAWLWGAPGLVLSTPLTVCVLVLGNHVPGMRFLSTLLGSEPALEPPAQFYQRMFSMESEDLVDFAAKHIAEHSVEEFYDEVLMPALLLSEVDRHSGALPEARQRFIFQAGRDLIEELERQDETARPEAAAAQAPASVSNGAIVLGLPARDEADEIVAAMLRHLLRRRGVTAGITPLAAPMDETLRAAGRAEVRAVFISALPPSAVAAARQMCRQVKQRAPAKPALVGVWRHHASAEELDRRFHGSQPDAIVTTLRDAVQRLAEMAGGQIAAPAEPPRSGDSRKIAPE